VTGKLGTSFALGGLAGGVAALLFDVRASTSVALGLVIALLAGGSVLWRWGDEKQRQLGTGLMGGLVVATAVGFAQYENERARESSAQREALRFALATQQDLTGLDAKGENLDGFYIRQKVLKVARFTDTKLQGAVLQRSDLYDADLRGADLTDANLIAVDLCGAELDTSPDTGRSTNLAGADLWRASLYKAKMDSGTNLSGARLEDTDLRRARGLERAKLEGAAYDSSTDWPQGFHPKRHGLEKNKPRLPPGLRVRSDDTGCGRYAG
jgi:Pentapeptide repeats (8 copies)